MMSSTLLSAPLYSAPFGTTLSQSICPTRLLSYPPQLLSHGKFWFGHRRTSIEVILRRLTHCRVKKEYDANDETCELVNGVEIVIDNGVDRFHSYLFKAVKNNNGTAILLLSDIFGFEDSATRDFAYRVACNGYNVLVPDLFGGNPCNKNWPKSSIKSWIDKQEPEMILKVIAASTKWMVDEFVAAGISKKLGVIGFCYGGGRVIELLGGDQAAYFGVGVSFYGTGMDVSIASNVQVPVLFISGDNDPLCPVNVLEDMERNIGSESRVVIFKKRGHGFAHRPASPEEDEDAEKAFLIMRNWLNVLNN